MRTVYKVKTVGGLYATITKIQFKVLLSLMEMQDGHPEVEIYTGGTRIIKCITECATKLRWGQP